jgi:hypothetical protein
MVARREAVRVVPHEVGYYDTDASQLVVQHDRATTGLAGAQLEWPVGILVIERHTIQALRPFDGQIAIPEKHHMCRGLRGDPLAHGTMAGVAIDGIGIRVRLVVLAATFMLV